MPEDTNTTPNLPVTSPASKTPTTNYKNLVLLIVLGLSLLLNVVMLVSYNLEKRDNIPYVDMSLAFPEPEIINYDDFSNGNEEGPTDYQFAETQEIRPLTSDPTDYSIYYKNLIKQEGVEWFDSPVLLPDQNLLVINSKQKLAYYQIGMRNTDPIVFVPDIPCNDMACTAYALMIINKNGTASLIEKNSIIDLTSEWSVVKLSPTVKIDSEFLFLALNPDKEINSLIGLKLNQPWYAGMWIYSETDFNLKSIPPSVPQQVEYIKDTSWGPLFRNYYVSEVGTVDYRYAIRLPGGLSMPYDEAPLGFMTDDRVPQITWLDGGVNTEPYRGDRLTGCGGGGPEVLLQPLSEPTIERVGTTKTGEAVYNVIDPTNPLITRIFEMTNGIVYDYENGQSSSRTITIDEFIANRGVLLVESLGRQLVLNNTKFGPAVECGKPVIYLYPEATTIINVSVDAMVTKSEPQYEETGWVATAHPDGSLIVNGQTYTSLFWDGYGNGVYPELKQGFVVPTSEVLDAMSDNLRYIGFNEFEISEFVAFWSDHLPEEPYTRFSWLQTVEMERLAKLTIDPRPDTLIRAFVDYEGVDEMIEIEPQKLIKRARNGYVVTEWGGLLRK